MIKSINQNRKQRNRSIRKAAESIAGKSAPRAAKGKQVRVKKTQESTLGESEAMQSEETPAKTEQAKPAFQMEEKVTQTMKGMSVDDMALWKEKCTKINSSLASRFCDMPVNLDSSNWAEDVEFVSQLSDMLKGDLEASGDLVPNVIRHTSETQGIVTIPFVENHESNDTVDEFMDVEDGEEDAEVSGFEML